MNCRKSTGPKTPAGKRRASRNAMKHGMCSALSHLPGECDATFHTYVAELEEELRPTTALQRVFFTEIANLSWRLMRLPEAQSKLFAEEMAKVAYDDGAELKASDVLARRFSDDPGCNGFALMERYERGMRSQLLRLFRQFDQLKKHRPTTPYDPSEPPCPSEGSKPAWTSGGAARVVRGTGAAARGREAAGPRVAPLAPDPPAATGRSDGAENGKGTGEVVVVEARLV